MIFKKRFIGGVMLSILALLLSACQQAKNEDLDIESKASESPQSETQTNEQDSITVSVNPLNIFDDGDNWSFEIELNTHVADLTTDLMQDAVLLDEKSQEFMPLTWIGDPPGGHHLSGVLSFKPVEGSFLTLKIANVSESGDRIFKFEK